MSQFIRRVQLQIQRPGAANARALEGLRITSTARRSVTPTPDRATITVYGAAPASLDDLGQSGALVRVLAGYKDGAFGVVLSGSIIPGTLDIIRQSGEVVATMEVADGRTEIRAATVSRAWDQTTASDVLAWAIQTAGLAAGSIVLGQEVAYTRGFVAMGTVADVLRQIGADTGTTIAVQDGVVAAYPAGDARRPSSLLFSPSSGLIGAPRRVEDGHVEVVALLAPTLRPGDGYRVESSQVSGDFIALDVTTEIDSQEGPFYSKIVGKRLG